MKEAGCLEGLCRLWQGYLEIVVPFLGFLMRFWGLKVFDTGQLRAQGS